MAPTWIWSTVFAPSEPVPLPHHQPGWPGHIYTYGYHSPSPILSLEIYNKRIKVCRRGHHHGVRVLLTDFKVQSHRGGGLPEDSAPTWETCIHTCCSIYNSTRVPLPILNPFCRFAQETSMVLNARKGPARCVAHLGHRRHAHISRLCFRSSPRQSPAQALFSTAWVPTRYST
jgi:hypothetical protein